MKRYLTSFAAGTADGAGRAAVLQLQQRLLPSVLQGNGPGVPGGDTYRSDSPESSSCSGLT